VWVRGGYTPLFDGAKALARRLSGVRVVPPQRPQRHPHEGDAPALEAARIAVLDLAFVYRVQGWLAVA
jgi:hypothetical protein